MGIGPLHLGHSSWIDPEWIAKRARSEKDGPIV
jgi:hypothetical protein